MLFSLLVSRLPGHFFFSLVTACCEVMVMLVVASLHSLLLQDQSGRDIAEDDATPAATHFLAGLHACVPR